MSTKFSVRLLAIAFISVLPLSLHADTDGIGKYLRADHPDVYTVVKGDTLWDISGEFLSRPWLWPEIWQINPQIENPHLIYPGDEIALVFVDGQPRLSLRRGDAGRTVRMSPGNAETLQPKIRAVPLETAIPAISLDAIQGFLVQNRVVEPTLLDAAPYVLDGEGERLILGAGDRVYVRGSLVDSEAYNIVREGPLYVDPETREVLGQEATYIGLGQATAQSSDNGVEIATLRVTSTREEVQIGDRVLPTEERRLDATFFPSSPNEDIRGFIISVFGGVTQVGQYDVVVVNRGIRDSLKVGDVLSIHRRGALARDRIAKETVRLPSERAGLLMVFRTFEKLSYALVLNTERPLAVGDEVRNP
ncbi:MAG: LysM peptidoglycan-binding domain-containing protein [Pseudomonadota bacterium]